MQIVVLSCASVEKTNIERPSATDDGKAKTSTDTNSPAQITYEEQINPVGQELQPKFEQQDLTTDPLLRKVDKRFETISIQEYRLLEHKLFRVSFNNPVLFKFDRSDFELVDVEELAQFATAFNDGNLGNYIFIVGNTDSEGTTEYNQSLSLRRSLVIADLIARKGISSEILKLVPAGESLPIASNATETGQASNRRVEILIAKSRELVKAFLREYDCKEIDPSCEQTILPIFDVVKQNNSLILDNEIRDMLVTQAPIMNDLNALSKNLRTNIEVADERYFRIPEIERINEHLPNARPTLIETTIRPSFQFEQQIRKPLRLPNKYYLSEDT